MTRARLLWTLMAAASLAALGLPRPAAAHPTSADLAVTFDNGPAGLFFTNFEGGARNSATMCGTDACARLVHAGHDHFLRIEVRPSANPGFYSNTDVSQLDIDQADITNTGPYTAVPGRPVTLTARIRFSENYDLAGTAGTAVGTAGVALWNTGFTGAGGPPAPDYDQIGFTWASSAVLGGAFAGLAGTSFVDQALVGVAPVTNIDPHHWFEVSLTWEADSTGAQRVTYRVGGTVIGVHQLPTPLHGLSLELWNDNQEPYLCPETGVCMGYGNPGQVQALDIDFVTITQPAHPHH